MRQVWGLLLFLGLTATALGQPLQTRIFQLNNRPAEATVEMVRPLLSPAGSVLPEARLQKLIVRDTSEKLQEVERLLEQIDLPAPHVRIQVDMHGVSQAQGHMIAIDPRYPKQSWTAVAGGGFAQAESQQSLTVMSGERGLIMMARDLVSVYPYLNFCQRYGLLPVGYLVQSVSTGFAVEPTVVGDVVRLNITPWMSFIGASGRQEVLATEASTTLALRSGQAATIAVGGSGNEVREQAFGLILGSRGQTVEQSGSITVVPEILQQ